MALVIAAPAPGSCIGFGLASQKLLAICARQPDLMPELQNKFFLAVGVPDGTATIATVMGL